MDSKQVQTVKMFGPALSGPARLVNRDVPVCDEQAYKAAGYKRGSIPDSEAPAEPVKSLSLGSEELSLDEPEAEPVAETPVAAPAEAPAKSRRKKGQN